MADPRHRDRITTTEGVRDMIESHEEVPLTPPTPSPKGDTPAKPDELTIIEPAGQSTESAAQMKTVDAMLTQLQHVAHLSLELPNSDYLSKVLVPVNLAQTELEQLKLHLQGYDV